MAGLATPALAQNVWHTSYYGQELAGRKTASGERFNPGALTAAHRTLPFGTKLKLTNIQNGRSVIVRINDRGPFVRGRMLDVSRGAASALGFVGQGTARLRVETLSGFAASSSPPSVDLKTTLAASEVGETAPLNDALINRADRALHN
ncbi:MAG: septal ring lytic transglycosylase RlpA family protein [Beijerinckiaceae bacterium]|nr:septal ring lytic transglycosylase RlpA family protein [Beijerinckiaceae bacterium]MCZ8301127.1 septal ring lytic transglycosylase RlpA family protein [Beijerinckiaceae bacterium]